MKIAVKVTDSDYKTLTRIMGFTRGEAIKWGKGGEMRGGDSQGDERGENRRKEARGRV